MTDLPAGISLARSALPLRPTAIGVLREVIAHVRRRRRVARALVHLEGLPDYLLADIGLTRDNLSPFIGDPHSVRWQRLPDLW